MKRLFTFIILLFTCINVCVAKDICIQIMANPPTHEIPEYNRIMGRYEKGDIRAVFLNSECPLPPSPNNPFVFVRITGVPVSSLKKAKKMMAPHRELVEEADGEMVYQQTRQREWKVDWQQLPPQLIDNLLENREITKTWVQVKPYIKSKILQRVITDEDLE